MILEDFDYAYKFCSQNILIIICFFIFIISSVVVSIILKIKSFILNSSSCIKVTKCSDNNCGCLSKRDFIYNVIILLMLLVFVSTFVLGDNDTILAYISFASTITSIILSILAIFMTVLSEYKNENTKNKIDIATIKIESSKNELTKLQENLSKNLSSYKDLLEKLDIVLIEIKNIEEETKNLKTVIENINVDGENNQKTIKPIIINTNATEVGRDE